jgi:hypothetical protein
LPSIDSTRNLPTILLTGLGQRLEDILPVHVIEKDILPPVAPAHDAYPP